MDIEKLNKNADKVNETLKIATTIIGAVVTLVGVFAKDKDSKDKK